MTTLTGHTSPETAYVVADYPYGFRLRCRMRHWIEYRKVHGFRHVTQTTNPKQPGTVWNKPKAGTYAPLMVLVRDDDGRVRSAGWSAYSTAEQLDAFERDHAAGITNQHRAELKVLRAMLRANERVTWTVRPYDDDTPAQTLWEQDALYRAVVADELRRAA